MANLNDPYRDAELGDDLDDSVFHIPPLAWPAVPIPETSNVSGFTDPAAVPHHSGDTPGPNAAHADISGGWDSVDVDDGDGSKITDNDWDDPGSINSGMSHEHPAFGRSSGARY